MTEPMPPANLPTAQDEEHLRLLTLFHSIVGGLTAAFASFGLFHFFIGLTLISHPSAFGPPTASSPPMPREMGYLFAVMGGLVVLLGWTLGALTIYAGRCLKARAHYIFILVMAGLNCLSMPIGTLLGVFTIVVLTRPSVKALFESRDAAS